MNKIGSIVSCALLAAFSSTAHSSTISFSEDFNSPTSGIDYVGNAAQIPGGGPCTSGCLKLTNNTTSQTGASWNDTAYTFNSFSTTFDFIIGPSSGGGADGFTFSVIDAATYDPATAIGGGGGGLGYLGLANSFSVEFDTWNNGAIDGGSANHVGINQNGSINSLARANLPFSLETADPTDWHTANIDFDESGLLSLAIDGTDYLSYTLSGFSNNVYFGFTGATGGAIDEHYIDNWNMTIAVPEPATLALFGAGLFGLGFMRKQKSL